MGSPFTARSPDGAGKPAYVMLSSGQAVTYAELEARSNQCAHVFRALGLGVHAHVAILTESNERVLELAWAARRSGLVYTMVPTHLTPAETAYIVNDCGAEVLFVSELKSAALPELTPLLSADCRIITITGPPNGGGELAELMAPMPVEPIDDEFQGTDMLYSSGTTGRPKGVLLPPGGPSGGSDILTSYFADLWSIEPDSIYLSNGPLYHSSPLRSCMSVIRIGGTALVMEKFDAATALATIEKYRVTHSQWVPTMFVRMLRLDPAVRDGFDLSSHRIAIHAAAPCPPEVKQQMMDWWGPILYEFYGATEGIGFVHITPTEWLAHPGSIGRAYGTVVHVVDEAGDELGPHKDGLLYFSGASEFEYHNDPEKTRSVHNDKGWRTAGDVGHVDDDGYIYLTDRQTFMIISGGVNIYPQEVENLLISHPAIVDAAVFGVPNAEMGEEVKAVVTLVDMSRADAEFATELIEFCRANLAHYKCPRSIDFEATLPRAENGKLYKRLLRDAYVQRARAGAGPGPA